VAVISQGTDPQQRTLVGTLANIARRAKEEGFEAPAVIVIGEVVQLREHLRWFDNRPLFGKRILVTRPEERTGKLSQLLRERGATPVEMPVIKILPPERRAELDQAIRSLKSYGWIIFTSVNAVEMFLGRLDALKRDARWLGDIKIGAIGPATAKSLEMHGVRPDYMPDVYTSHGFLTGLDKKAIAGQKVLLPRADIAGNELTDGLIALGAQVYQVTAYRTVAVKDADSPGKRMLLKGEIGVITFTSASTVNNLVAVLGRDWEAIKKAKLACIGPNTAAALAQKGLKPDIVAREHTIQGLAEAIERYFEAEVAR